MKLTCIGSKIAGCDCTSLTARKQRAFVTLTDDFRQRFRRFGWEIDEMSCSVNVWIIVPMAAMLANSDEDLGSTNIIGGIRT